MRYTRNTRQNILEGRERNPHEPKWGRQTIAGASRHGCTPSVNVCNEIQTWKKEVF